MRRPQPIRKSNVKIAYLFFAFLIIAICVSFLLKLITLVKQSKFDGAHQLILFVASSQSPAHKNIISFAPGSHTISVLEYDSDKKSEEIGKALEIPIDATAIFQRTNLRSLMGEDEKSIDGLLKYMLFHVGEQKTDLTIIDIVRLYFFTQGVSVASVQETRMSPNLDDASQDKIVASLFADYSLATEKKSIEIVNGADVPGLGSRLARLLNNIGGNVVAVSTSEQGIEKSEILYTDKPSYTLDRLQKILKFPIVKDDKTEISDIIIRIGKDSLGNLSF